MRGLNEEWKQPLTFYFNKDGAKTDDLHQLIPTVIKAVNPTGLIVRAVECAVKHQPTLRL